MLRYNAQCPHKGVLTNIHKLRTHLVAPKVPNAAGEGGVSALGDCHVGDSAQELRR